jgi:hypothetical protein
MRRARVGRAGRWQPQDVPGLYLAGSTETVWAEWYRQLAERELEPSRDVPRELWRFAVRLDRVADMTSQKRLADAGLPQPRPTISQWPVFQTLGSQLAGEGVQAILYTSAAHVGGVCLCVFRDLIAQAAVHPIGPPFRIDDPPPPPRGLRT